MRIELRPTLVSDKNPYLKDATLIDLIWLVNLLKEIQMKGNLNSISKQSPASFRSAWGRLTLVETNLSLELVVRRKGQGARLSEFGVLLVQFIEEMKNRCDKENSAYQEALLKTIERIRLVENNKWKFFSSSDAIMKQAVDHINGFDLKIIDSSEAIHKLLIGEADIAGYNTSNPDYSISIYQHFLKNEMQAFPVARRTQGLLVKKGNPLKIHSINDLTKKNVRFINRQKGSGTRILLDELLQEAQINPCLVNGYLNEELQHTSLANAILANQADVGLGVVDVALASNLDFIPLREEIFFVAMRKELIEEPKIAKLIRAIRKHSQETPGYDAIYLNRDVEKWIGTSLRKKKAI